VGSGFGKWRQYRRAPPGGTGRVWSLVTSSYPLVSTTGASDCSRSAFHHRLALPYGVAKQVGAAAGWPRVADPDCRRHEGAEPRHTIARIVARHHPGIATIVVVTTAIVRAAVIAIVVAAKRSRVVLRCGSIVSIRFFVSVFAPIRRVVTAGPAPLPARD